MPGAHRTSSPKAGCRSFQELGRFWKSPKGHIQPEGQHGVKAAAGAHRPHSLPEPLLRQCSCNHNEGFVRKHQPFGKCISKQKSKEVWEEFAALL